MTQPNLTSNTITSPNERIITSQGAKQAKEGTDFKIQISPPAYI
jgi:hypothetical protein